MFDELVKDKGVKINIFGSRENLPKKIIDIFEKSEKLSKNNKNLNLNIAFNYGFKNELKNIFRKFQEQNIKINLEDDQGIKNLFFLESVPDPDILIRTGGYQRLSNFIMYNLTYTELFFTDTLWPDFSIDELKKILEEFSNINRKYGL